MGKMRCTVEMDVTMAHITHTHAHAHAHAHTHTFNLEVVEWFRVDPSNGPLLVAGECPIASDYKEPRPPVLDELTCQQTAHKQLVMH